VLAFDQLGYGKSDKPADFPYTMDAMAEVVDEFLEKTGTPSAVLVGNSMGGEVSLATALQFPARVEAMVLVSPAGFERFSKKEKEWFRSAFSAAFVKSATEYGIWGSVKGANFSRWKNDYEWLIEERVRLAKSKQFDPYAYAQVRSVDGLAHNDFVRDSLGKIETPTLIALGQEDRLIPNPYLHGGWARTEFSWGAAQIKGSQLVGFDHCGHLLMMDCHDELNPKMFEFIAALPPKVKPAPVEPPAAVPAPEPQTEVAPEPEPAPMLKEKPAKKSRRTASARDYTKRQ
jgi:pimeloyl-ACP methyl ester carboxylesterase